MCKVTEEPLPELFYALRRTVTWPIEERLRHLFLYAIVLKRLLTDNTHELTRHEEDSITDAAIKLYDELSGIIADIYPIQEEFLKAMCARAERVNGSGGQPHV